MKMIRICAWCKKPIGKVSRLALRKLKPGTYKVTHGICKKCASQFKLLLLIPTALLSAL